ncbi:MAG: DUF3105 domain-containing protein [Patescibacteria group bacterium]
MGQSAKKIIYWLVGLGLIWLAIYGIYQAAKSGGGPLPGQFFPAQSRNHINVGASHPDYNSNPPTGGWHYDNPVQTGIYDKEPPDEQLIHNLEHGHIWVSYRLDLPKDQQDKLADIAKRYGSRIIVAPRAKNDSPIALAAWQYLLKLDNIDEVQINAFIKAHRNIAGPERNIPDYGFKDFRSR